MRLIRGLIAEFNVFRWAGRMLLDAAGRVLTRRMLDEQLYVWGEAVGSNALEVHIHHLRRKLGSELIRTVRGVGYMVDEAPK